MLLANSAIKRHLIVFNRLIRSPRGRYFTGIPLGPCGVERLAIANSTTTQSEEDPAFCSGLLDATLSISATLGYWLDHWDRRGLDTLSVMKRSPFDFNAKDDTMSALRYKACFLEGTKCIGLI